MFHREICLIFVHRHWIGLHSEFVWWSVMKYSKMFLWWILGIFPDSPEVRYICVNIIVLWYFNGNHLIIIKYRMWIYKHGNTWWRHQMETFSALLAICAGNSPVPGEFPTQRPVTGSFDVFFDLCLNKRLRKQSRGWWFETLSCPLWRHRNDVFKPLFTDLCQRTMHWPLGNVEVYFSNSWIIAIHITISWVPPVKIVK